MRNLEKFAVLLRWNFLERIAFALSEGDPTFQGKRDSLFRPLAVIAIYCGLSANTLSILGAVFACFAAIVIFHPILASVLLAISLFLDGLDGVVARATKTTSKIGEVLDIVCDTVGVLAIVTGLMVWGYLSAPAYWAYVAVLVSYTSLSSFKSEVLTGKYRSIGSRVVVTSYVGLCLALAAFIPVAVVQYDLVSYGVLGVTLVLLFNLLWDIVGISGRALRNRYLHLTQ